MPRQTDHEQRRRQIAEAVWRLATRIGLEGVTLRQVAAEAGVSARLLQYYFGTRDELLLGALKILNEDADIRAGERMALLGEDPELRDIVRGVLLELLPLDEERRNRHIVYAAYFVRFLVEPALAAIATEGSPALEDLLTTLLTQARANGEVSGDVDVATEAAFLLAGAWGLQSDVLLGTRTPEGAVELVDRQLARVFG